MDSPFKLSRREERLARETKITESNVRDYMELKRRNTCLLDELLEMHSKYKRLCIDYNTDLKFYESKLKASEKMCGVLKNEVAKTVHVS